MTAAAILQAIEKAAQSAAGHYPNDVDMRSKMFVAGLAGRLSAQGHTATDDALMNLLATPAERAGMEWWNGLSEEQRRQWTRVTHPPTVANAYAAFLADPMRIS